MNTRLISLCLSFGIIGFISIWHIPQTIIAQPDTNFLTYTNPDLGFTVQHPHDWTVNDNLDPASVYIVSPSGPRTASAIISVNPSATPDMTLEQLGNTFLESNEDNKYSANLRLTEMNTNNYFLGGHPAVRVVAVGTTAEGIETKFEV